MFPKPSVTLRMIIILGLMGGLIAGPVVFESRVAAQSGRQAPKKDPEKKTNVQKSADQPNAEDVPVNPQQSKDEPTLKLSTQVVSMEVTVVDKKTHRLYNKLTKKNFTVYEDGVKQEVTNLSTGEGPATVVLLIDNSARNRDFTGMYSSPAFILEIFHAAMGFVRDFVKPRDFVALVEFSMKPKVVQDFTGDKQRLMMALNAAGRDTINFHESNIFDSLSFVLLGGKAMQLYEEEGGENKYLGLQELEGHTAVVLITLGIDTFSKLTFDKTLKIVSTAGVPVFTVGVGNMLFKAHGDDPRYARILGGHMNFLQAQNQLNAFAQRSGGQYFPMTFEGEIPSIMQTISALIRSQYSIGYVPTNTRAEGKERKIKLEVDVDGDGKPDNERLELRYRDRYYESGGDTKGGKSKK
jgi:VWFA-related protein